MKQTIYMDNAATTPVSSEVLEAMMPFLTTEYGNPSSFYTIGQAARAAVETARASIAACLGARPSEIFFTSGGSEADNWAIKGVAAAQKKRGKTHIITTKFEHHAVLHAVEALEKDGFEATYLEVHEDGIVRPEELEAAIREGTALVTVMYANNEIGTIQPIAELGAICKAHGVPFHTDAVQAIGQVPIDVSAQHIDLLSLSGHKLHAQKGIGALYCRGGVRTENLIDGGAQERGRRAGTENVPAIVGLAKAVQLACTDMESRTAAIRAKRDKLISGLLAEIPFARLNGHPEKRLAGNLNLCFEGIEGEGILMMLDAQGVCGSSGSACTSGSLDPSHVLLAIGLPHGIAHGSLRLSLSERNTDEEVEEVLRILPPIIKRLRSMSPVWDEMVSEHGDPYQ